MGRSYSFTRQELADLLLGTFDLFFEHEEWYSREEFIASHLAIRETLESLDANA